MQSEAAELQVHERLWSWYLVHKRETATAAGAVVIIGLVVAFILYQKNAKVTNAGEALSQAMMDQASAADHNTGNPTALLRVATDYSGTPAAGYALLMAADNLYVAGKYPEAQAKFEQYLSADPGSRMEGPAMLGIAACLEGAGKTNEAMTAYQRVANRQADISQLQAKFALGRLYENQGKFEQARALYDEVGRAGGQSSLGQEAGLRMHELIRAHPDLAPGKAATNAPAANIATPPAK